jgi:hypothetical protein
MLADLLICVGTLLGFWGRIVLLTLVAGLFSAANACDGLRGYCPLLIDEQISIYAQDRASKLGWPFQKVILERHTRASASVTGQSDKQLDEITEKIVNQIVVLATSDSSAHIALYRIVDPPASHTRIGEYRSIVRRMLQDNQAFSMRLKWYFRGLAPFETTALFANKPTTQTGTGNLLFEPTLDIDGKSWKIDSWRKTFPLPYDSPNGCVKWTATGVIRIAPRAQ